MRAIHRKALLAAVLIGAGCESPPNQPARRDASVADSGSPCSWAPEGLPESHELRFGLESFGHVDEECSGPPKIEGRGFVAVGVSGDPGHLTVLAPDGGGVVGGPRGRLTPLDDGFLCVECSGSSIDSHENCLVYRWRPGDEPPSSYGGPVASCSDEPDASGGVTTVTAGWPPHMGYHVRVNRFDATAQATGGVELFHATQPCSAWAATDSSGATLAIYGVPTSCDEVLQWFDASGAPITAAVSPQDSRAGDLSTAHFQALVGGGFAIDRDGQWLGVLATGATRTSEPPAWLRALPVGNLELAPRHRGYIVHGVADAGPDSERVALIDQDGEFCGDLDVPVPQGKWSVGVDGSIGTLGMGFGDGGRQCAITIWSHVFR